MKTKNELKQEYKQMKFVMGVFQIRNTVNNKIFIDSSANINAKKNRHTLQLDVGSHPVTALQHDWKELGADKFVFETLGEVEQNETETVDYDKEIKMLEAMYLEDLQPYDDKGYNKRPKQ